ncbi:hypothetical protein DMENIID0001_105650 [Sergentomyia squamirostris]
MLNFNNAGSAANLQVPSAGAEEPQFCIYANILEQDPLFEEDLKIASKRVREFRNVATAKDKAKILFLHRLTPETQRGVQKENKFSALSENAKTETIQKQPIAEKLTVKVPPILVSHADNKTFTSDLRKRIGNNFVIKCNVKPWNNTKKLMSELKKMEKEIPHHFYAASDERNFRVFLSWVVGYAAKEVLDALNEELKFKT